MDPVEDLLREELGRLSERPAPETATMLRRVATRRRRTRVALAGAVSAIAVLVSTVGVVATLRPDRAWGPARPDHSPTASLPGGLTMIEPAEIHFADASHGFALLASCPDATCTIWLAATANGGASWQAHQVPGLTYPRVRKPGVAAGGDPRVDFRVLDASRVSLDRWDDSRRWFTTDAGVTWSEPPPEPAGVVDEIPVGGLAEVETTGGGPIGVVVLLPDGRLKRLARPPSVPITGGSLGVAFGADGSAWIFGGSGNRTWLLVSRDRGRSWTEVPLPNGSSARGNAMDSYDLHAEDGRSIYLVEKSARRVFRLGDDGKTWRQLALTLPPKREDLGIVAVSLFDGGLLAYDIANGQAYAITRQGERFEPVNTQPMGRIGARYLKLGPGASSDGTGGGGPYFHSADGRTWTELRF